MSDRRIVCDECTRADLLRAAAGRGLPAIEPGMPVPAGTGLTRRGFVARSLGLALSVYGAGRLAAVRRRDRERRRRDASSRSSSPCSCRAAPTRCRCSIRRATRSIRSTARRWPSRAAPRSPRTPGSSGTRRSRRSRQLHDEGKVTVFPSIGYDHPDQSHFTSRHYWEVGATDPRLHHGLARPLPRRVRLARQPAAGALARRLAAAEPRDRPRAGGDDRLSGPVRLLDARRLGIRPGPAARRDRRSRRASALTTPAFKTAANVAHQSNRLRRSCSRSPARSSRRRSPYPKSNDSFPTQLSGLAAMIAAGLPLHCVALEASGSYDTHADQTTELGAGARYHRRLAARLPARPRVARHRRPRADARLERVRPPSAGERLGRDRSRRRRVRLPDRHARARDAGRRVPRPRRPRPGRQPEADVRLPLRLLVAARAVAAHGRRARDPGRRRSSSGPSSSSEARGRGDRSGRRLRSQATVSCKRRGRRPFASRWPRASTRSTLSALRVKSGPADRRARQLRPGRARPAAAAARRRGTSPGSGRSARGGTPTSR